MKQVAKILHAPFGTLMLFGCLFGVTVMPTVGDSLIVTRVPGPPVPGTFILGQSSQDMGGNTRFRYYPPELRDVSAVGFDTAVRSDLGAQREYPDAHRYRSPGFVVHQSRSRARRILPGRRTRSESRAHRSL